MSVEFRVGVTTPPTPAPKRSIYTDIVDLPDPINLSITVRIYNYDAVGLYMRMDGTLPATWTFSTEDLGLLASGSNFRRNLDRFATRALPVAETTEILTIRLRAYTDAGYTDLKWTYTRDVNVLMIKSNDGSWTQDYYDNFDDGTTQGWTKTNEAGYSGADGLATNYVLTVPYSRYAGVRSADEATVRFRIDKGITTPNRNTVYAIAEIRLGRLNVVDNWLKYFEGRVDGVAVVWVGRPSDGVSANYVPINRWMRVVFPLPKNSAITVAYAITGRSRANWDILLWFENFTVISK